MASEILRKLFSLGVLKQDNPLSVFLVTGTFILATENNTRENKKGITSSVVDQSQAYQRLHVSAVEQANILVQTDIENASCVNTEYIFYSVEAGDNSRSASQALIVKGGLLSDYQSVFFEILSFAVSRFSRLNLCH